MNFANEQNADLMASGARKAGIFEDALAELPQQTLDIFLLVLCDHARQGDVARAFHMSTKAVDTELCKALGHIAKRLSAHPAA
jgi:DNA-directed RNA polymerase specialized sigma24 family protein